MTVQAPAGSLVSRKMSSRNASQMGAGIASECAGLWSGLSGASTPMRRTYVSDRNRMVSPSTTYQRRAFAANARVGQ